MGTWDPDNRNINAPLVPVDRKSRKGQSCGAECGVWFFGRKWNFIYFNLPFLGVTGMVVA